jgi:hypothetical protein
MRLARRSVLHPGFETIWRQVDRTIVLDLAYIKVRWAYSSFGHSLPDTERSIYCSVTKYTIYLRYYSSLALCRHRIRGRPLATSCPYMESTNQAAWYGEYHFPSLLPSSSNALMRQSQRHSAFGHDLMAALRTILLGCCEALRVAPKNTQCGGWMEKGRLGPLTRHCTFRSSSTLRIRIALGMCSNLS